MFAARYEKSFVPAFFTCKVSIDHLFHISVSLEKNYCLEKVLNFGSKVLKEPCAFKSSRIALRNRSMGPTTMFKRLLFNSVLIYS